MPRGGIPDRWEDYTNPVGDQIPGTRFITFKVPLHPRMCRHLGNEERFTPSRLLRILDDQGQNLGLIIDLTQTDRYYSPTEFLDNNIEHIKIPTVGQVVPNRKTCNRFTEAVDRFLKENKDNDSLIGVHCTHGVNRTGYLVCRYMIDKLDFQPENAIEAFNTARGYDIERENYLRALRNSGSGDCYRDGNHSRNRPHDRSNPRGYNNFVPHGYQGYEGHQRPHHRNHNGTFNGGYYPGHRGRYGDGRPRNPYQSWNNGFPERQFGHQHQSAYSAGSTKSGAPPLSPPGRHSPNNQWNGAFDSNSRHSSSSYSWPATNKQHPEGERNYGRSWSGPSSGHRSTNSPSGRSNRKFNPYSSYDK